MQEVIDAIKDAFGAEQGKEVLCHLASEKALHKYIPSSKNSDIEKLLQPYRHQPSWTKRYEEARTSSSSYTHSFRHSHEENTRKRSSTSEARGESRRHKQEEDFHYVHKAAREYGSSSSRRGRG